MDFSTSFSTDFSVEGSMVISKAYWITLGLDWVDIIGLIVGAGIMDFLLVAKYLLDGLSLAPAPIGFVPLDVVPLSNSDDTFG